MICAKCGQNLPDNSKFCSACGERVVADSPEASFDVVPENDARDSVITIEPVTEQSSPAFETQLAASGDFQPETSARSAVALEGVAKEEIEDLFYSISPASERRFSLRARYAVIPLITIAVAAVIIAAIAVYSASYVGIARSLLSLSRDFSERIASTPFAVFSPLSECLIDGNVAANIVYTDEYGDDFTLDFTLLSNSQSKSRLLRASAIVYETPIDMELYLNSERAAVGSSILGGDYYGFRYDTFSSDVRRFAVLSGIEDLDFETLEQYVKILQNATSDNSGARQYTGQAETLLRDFAAAQEPVRAREKISRNGKLITSQVYSYNIDTHDVFVLLMNYIDLVRSDEYMLGQLTQYFESTAQYDGYGYYDPIFGGYYYADSPSEAAIAFLEDFWLTLEFIDSVCDGEVTFKLYSVKNRISAVELGIDVSIEGLPFGALITIDFGLSPQDDWMLLGNIWNSWYEYSFGATWQYKKSGDSCESSLKLTFGDSFDSRQFTVSSVWNIENGAFALTLRAPDGIDRQLRGNLTLDKKSFKLRLDTAVQLRIDISGMPEAEIGAPDYINLDKWSRETVSGFETALMEMYASIYKFG